MEQKRTDLLLTAGLCSLLILAVSIAGCTSSDAGAPVPVTTPAQADPTSLATTLVLPSLTPSQAQAAVPPATQTQTTILSAPSQDPVSLTINSANKQTKVYTFTPNPGNIFLLLDITVKNNAVEKGFDLTESSISLSYAKSGTSPVPSITSKVRGGLDNPLIMPTRIEQHDQRTGQVAFGVADNSGRYTIKLIGTDGTVVSSASIDLR